MNKHLVGITISQIIMYIFLIVNAYLIFTKESITAQVSATVSSLIFITLLVLLYKSQYKKRSET